MNATDETAVVRIPWNKGKLTGQKPPLKLKEIWAIRVRLQLSAKIGAWLSRHERSTRRYRDV